MRLNEIDQDEVAMRKSKMRQDKLNGNNLISCNFKLYMV